MWWQSNGIVLPQLFSKLSINYFTFQIMKSETKSNEISSSHPFFRMICFRYIFFVENVQSYLWHSFWYEEFWIKIFLIFDNIVAELKITNFLFNLNFFLSSSIFFIPHKCSKSRQKLSMSRRTSLYLLKVTQQIEKEENKVNVCWRQLGINEINNCPILWSWSRNNLTNIFHLEDNCLILQVWYSTLSLGGKKKIKTVSNTKYPYQTEELLIFENSFESNFGIYCFLAGRNHIRGKLNKQLFCLIWIEVNIQNCFHCFFPSQTQCRVPHLKY